MDQALDLLSWILLVGGSVFAVIGGIGLVRLPDFFSRTHAGGVTDTMGAGMILAGLVLQAGLTLVGWKLLLIGVLIFITSPTSVHALAQSALAHGVRPLLDTDGKQEEPR
jgi:multicomponent Na+:H+ antiporter subunit G